MKLDDKNLPCRCGHPKLAHNEATTNQECLVANCWCAEFLKDGRNHMEEKRLEFKGGLSGTEKPKFSLIPYAALVSLAERFDLGYKKYGETSWNGYQSTPEKVTEEWVISRLEHVIHHAMTAIGKIKGSIHDDGDDDAGAILFGGAALAEFGKFQKEKK